LFAAVICLFSLISCSQNPQKEINRGVYFWKSNFTLSKEEQNWLKETEIQKLYMRFFDVDWNSKINSAVPIGDVIITTKDIGNIEIIPVVFITKRILSNIPDSLVSELSGNIYKKIFGKLSFFKNQTIKEIQLDCDWTETTREKYFNIIEHLKQLCKEKKIEITATIRLHQVKYFDITGVPPVKRGMLMFYNMSDVSDIRTINSIYDEDVAKRYLVNFDRYPLDLDVVLPAFSWACWFRGEKLKNLINDLKACDLEKSQSFVKEDTNIFRAGEDCFINGNYISSGDFLRTEETDFRSTLGAAKLLAPHIKNTNLTISIYHLNEEVVKSYGKDEFQDIVSSFY
jgi:hypothetical protein